MSFNINTEQSLVEKVARESARVTEESILDQLNELVSRGLLLIEETKPTLHRSVDSNKISIEKSIRLVLKDQEYIENLESKVKNLEESLEKYHKLVEEVKKSVLTIL